MKTFPFLILIAAYALASCGTSNPTRDAEKYARDIAKQEVGNAQKAGNQADQASIAMVRSMQLSDGTTMMIPMNEAAREQGLEGVLRPSPKISEKEFKRAVDAQSIEIAKLRDEAYAALNNPRYNGDNFIIRISPKCATSMVECTFWDREWPEGRPPRNVWQKSMDGSRYIVPSWKAITKLMKPVQAMNAAEKSPHQSK